MTLKTTKIMLTMMMIKRWKITQMRKVRGDRREG